MDTDLGIHLTWTYTSVFTKWLNSCFKIKTATGEIKTTEIKISDGGAYFPSFKSLYILKSLVNENDYQEIPFSDIIGGIKQESSYSTFTLQGAINFKSIEILSGYRINDQDLNAFIDFGTAYNSEKDFVSFLGLKYKTKDTYIIAPRWDPQYAFDEQKYNIKDYREGNENNLTLVKKDCIPMQPNFILDTEFNVSKWSRGKIFQNKWAHIEATYYIYKDNSSGNIIIKEEWEDEENGKKVTKTKETKYAFKTNNLILDIQAPGGKGANGSKDWLKTACGGGGGAFCRLIINLDNTNGKRPYILTIAACTTEENQSPNYSEIGLKGEKKIRLQSGYNGSLDNPGEGGKIYTPVVAPGDEEWEQLESETNFNYKNFLSCKYKSFGGTGKTTTKPIKDMIVLSYAAGKSQKEGNFSSKDALCNGTSSTFPFFNEDNKRGYAGKTMEIEKRGGFKSDIYGGGGGGASILGYGQKGRSVGESMQDYDTDWHAYGGGGGGGVSDVSLKNNKRTYGTYGQPGCFIVYGLGDKIATSENSSN